MTTYYVRKSGNDSNSGLTIPLAKLTIASAITASTTGDTIDIGAGVFAENINSSRTYTGAGMFKTSITGITSAWNSLTMAFNTIKLVHSSLTSYIYGCNLTFTDTYYDMSVGGSSSGGFIFAANDTVSAVRSIFIQPTFSWVSPLANGAFNQSYDHCIFANIRLLNTGYFCAKGAGDFSITNSIVYFSSSTSGRGISLSSTAWTIEQYNCFYGNGGALGSLPGGAFGTGTLNNADPLFYDAAGGDFRLSDSSPCIATGHA